MICGRLPKSEMILEAENVFRANRVPGFRHGAVAELRQVIDGLPQFSHRFEGVKKISS